MSKEEGLYRRQVPRLMSGALPSLAHTPLWFVSGQLFVKVLQQHDFVT
jgi:hypothetical protein